MKKDKLLVVSAVFFTAGSVLHLVRFFTGADFVIFGFEFPLLLSLLIAVIAAIFSYMLFNPKD